AAFDAPSEKAAPLLDKLLGLATSANDERSLARALSRVADPQSSGYMTWQFAALAGVLDALDRRGETLAKFHAEVGGELRPAIEKLDGLFTQARAQVKREAET